MRKRISKKEIVEAVKAAYKEGRQWCQLDTGHYYQVRINLDNAHIWCDFLSESEWYSYHSDTIQQILTDGFTVADKEVGYIAEAVRMLREAGWVIVEEA